MKKYGGNELNYLKQVLNNKKPNAGSWNKELEKKFSKVFKGKYAIAMNSGTATLHSALEALGVGAGDEVISPALTVIMDTTATLHANAIPVYADVDRETYNITADEIEKKITKKTKAIIVVSVYGLPCDMDEIMKLSKKYKIPIIEDHAQTVLATVNNKIVGVRGDFASWSFESSKHISSGEGGMLLTNNSSLAQKMTRQGGLLSEFGIHEPISKWNFPKRNRIIAGLSELTIVIESPSKGGSLITAELANGYNQEVMAIPGSIFSTNSSGCNELIKNQKAHVMTSPGDLFSIMDWDENYFEKDFKYDLKPEEKVLVTFLMNKNNSTFDQLAEGTKFSVALLQSLILNLELHEIILVLPGSRFRINHKLIGQNMA